MSAENKCEKQILHHQSHVIGLHYVPMESGVNKTSGWHQRCKSRVAILNVIKKHNSRTKKLD
jgi:hypothetical protein